jgi:hypothetical protein
MPGMLLKKPVNEWMLHGLCLLYFIAFCNPVSAQIEPLDTLQPKAPQIEAPIQNVQFGIVKPGTIVDTMRIQTKAVGHSPRKAVLFAAVLPGLGQVYNGKYWKIPILYGGIMAVGYGIAFQNDRLSVFEQAKLAEEREVENENPLAGIDRDFQIDSNIERIRRDRDFMMIIMAGVYALSIADAIVDAHLREFEVNEDLSFRLKPSISIPPSILGGQFSIGLALNLTFK